MLGTRGLTGVKHIVLGSVAERTVRLAPCPVLAVKEGDPGGPLRRIVVATDFSEPGDHARDVGVALAKQLGAEVHLVHAFDIPLALVTPYEVAVPDGLIREAREAARKKLDRALDEVRAKGVKATGHLAEVPAAPAIADLAAELKADLVVIGTHGRTGLQHVLLGSVAERTLRLAPCAVLTVKPTDHQLDAYPDLRPRAGSYEPAFTSSSKRASSLTSGSANSEPTQSPSLSWSWRVSEVPGRERELREAHLVAAGGGREGACALLLAEAEAVEARRGAGLLALERGAALAVLPAPAAGRRRIVLERRRRAVVGVDAELVVGVGIRELALRGGEALGPPAKVQAVLAVVLDPHVGAGSFLAALGGRRRAHLDRGADARHLEGVAAVDGGGVAVVVGHRHGEDDGLGCVPGGVAGLEGELVDPAVPGAGALGAHERRRAACVEEDVLRRVAVAVCRCPPRRSCRARRPRPRRRSRCRRCRSPKRRGPPRRRRGTCGSAARCSAEVIPSTSCGASVSATTVIVTSSVASPSTPSATVRVSTWTPGGSVTVGIAPSTLTPTPRASPVQV